MRPRLGARGVDVPNVHRGEALPDKPTLDICFADMLVAGPAPRVGWFGLVSERWERREMAKLFDIEGPEAAHPWEEV